MGHRLGRQSLEDVAVSAKPDSILGWYRKLIAKKLDRSKSRHRSRSEAKAQYKLERVHPYAFGSSGGIKFLHGRSDHTEGLITYYVLFFIHLGSRKVWVAGMTPHPDEEWTQQMARNATLEQRGFLGNCLYLLHDRDSKFSASFDEFIKMGNVKPIRLPARSPNLNAYAERWVKSVKEECLSKLILFGVASLKQALEQYVIHYHAERNHQAKGNVLLFQSKNKPAGNKGDCLVQPGKNQFSGTIFEISDHYWTYHRVAGDGFAKKADSRSCMAI